MRRDMGGRSEPSSCRGVQLHEVGMGFCCEVDITLLYEENRVRELPKRSGH